MINQHTLYIIFFSTGISPISLKLKRIGTDYPQWWRRILYFPSLAWINTSDAFLRFLVFFGSASALCVILGIFSNVAMFCFWMTYLSLVLVMDFEFPWDGKDFYFYFLFYFFIIIIIFFIYK